MQISYTEGLALALVLAVITCIVKVHYWWAAVALSLLGLTRGVPAAFAPALVLYAIFLWRQGTLNRGRTFALAALAVWAGACGFVWPLIAGFVTGEPRAYLLTQEAWHPKLTSPPITRFVEQSANLPGGLVTATLIAAFWVVLLLWVFTHGQSEPMLRAWALAYTVYILAVMDWDWSSVRYYLLAIPVLWPLVRTGVPEYAPRQRVAVTMGSALIGIAAQWWWIRYCLIMSPEFVQQP